MNEIDEWIDDEEYNTVDNDEQASEPAPARRQDGLLPCPFCGSPAEPYEYKVSKKYVIVCTNTDCLAESGFDLGVSGAVERWNTRPRESDLELELLQAGRVEHELNAIIADKDAEIERLQQLAEKISHANGLLSMELSAQDDDIDKLQAAVDLAIEFAVKYGDSYGIDHKAWVIDQMVRALTGDSYEQVVADACAGEDGPDTYGWSVGIAP